MTTYDWFALVAILLCLLLSAFFSSSETALTASSRARIHRMEKHGNREAAMVTAGTQSSARQAMMLAAAACVTPTHCFLFMSYS